MHHCHLGLLETFERGKLWAFKGCHSCSHDHNKLFMSTSCSLPFIFALVLWVPLCEVSAATLGLIRPLTPPTPRTNVNEAGRVKLYTL